MLLSKHVNIYIYIYTQVYICVYRQIHTWIQHQQVVYWSMFDMIHNKYDYALGSKKNMAKTPIWGCRLVAAWLKRYPGKLTKNYGTSPFLWENPLFLLPFSPFWKRKSIRKSTVNRPFLVATLTKPEGTCSACIAVKLSRQTHRIYAGSFLRLQRIWHDSLYGCVKERKIHLL